MDKIAAIVTLKDLRNWLDDSPFDTPKAEVEAIDMAIEEMMNKPKKPHWFSSNTKNKGLLEGYCCPDCGCELLLESELHEKEVNYCRLCGRMIDWRGIIDD